MASGKRFTSPPGMAESEAARVRRSCGISVEGMARACRLGTRAITAYEAGGGGGLTPEQVAYFDELYRRLGAFLSYAEGRT